MLYFKCIGAVLLFAAGILLAGQLAEIERRRVTQAEALLSLLAHFSAQIECFSTPVSRILAECDGELLASIGWRGEGRPEDLSALLAAVPLLQKKEISRSLRQLASSLGGSYRAEQLRAIEYQRSHLLSYCEGLRRELSARVRVALLLPMAGVLALIILLI